jgi:hypothetical protein
LKNIKILISPFDIPCVSALTKRTVADDITADPSVNAASSKVSSSSRQNVSQDTW